MWLKPAPQWPHAIALWRMQPAESPPAGGRWWIGRRRPGRKGEVRLQVVHHGRANSAHGHQILDHTERRLTGVLAGARLAELDDRLGALLAEVGDGRQRFQVG